MERGSYPQHFMPELMIDEWRILGLDFPMFRIHKTTLLHTLFWSALLLAGLAVRLIGLRHGETGQMVYHPDVAKQSLVAQYVYRGDCNIRKIFRDDFHETLYPYGSAVLLGEVARMAHTLTGKPKLHHMHRFYWALWLRYLSVASILFGTAIMIWTLVRHLGEKAAALAGLLLLFEPVQVQMSHYGMNDIPLLAFLYLTLAAAWAMPGEKRFPLYSLLAGLTAGMAFAIKYQGLLALVFPGLFWLFLVREKSIRWAASSLLAVGAGFLAGCLPLSPLLLHDPETFFTTFPIFMEWQTHIMGEAIPLGTKLQTNLYALASISLHHGSVLLWGGGIWAGLHAIRHRREPRIAAPLFSVLLFCALLLTAMIFSRDLLRENDLIPIYALLIMATAFPAARFLSSSPSRARRALFWALFVIQALVFVSFSIQDSLALRRTDTRVLAREWCEQNLPPKAMLIWEMYTLQPEREDLGCFRARYLSDLLPHQAIENDQVQYLITSSLASSRYAYRGSPFYSRDTYDAYADLFSHSRLQASFRDRPLIYAQPDIDIYEWIPVSP